MNVFFFSEEVIRTKEGISLFILVFACRCTDTSHHQPPITYSYSAINAGNDKFLSCWGNTDHLTFTSFSMTTAECLSN